MRNFDRVWRVASVTALFALGTAGCGGSGNPGTPASGPAAAPEVKLAASDMAGFQKTKAVGHPGGRFVDASYGDPKTFNPLIANETSSTDHLTQVLTPLLIRNPETTDFDPALAE